MTAKISSTTYLFTVGYDNDIVCVVDTTAAGPWFVETTQIPGIRYHVFSF